MDITQTGVWNMLLQLAREGHLHALLLGPPCESWSVARFVALGPDEHGPRPLRSLERLWMEVELTFRELSQVGLGNILLLRGLWLSCITASKGGQVIVEHPAEKSGYPCIWRTQLVQHLVELGLFAKTTVEQFAFGSAGVKPTTFLYANCRGDTLSRFGRSDLCRPQRGLIGRSEGQFRTFKAKEYPPLLNQALALVMLHKPWVGTTMEKTPPWLNLIEEFAMASKDWSRQSIMPDCQL